MINDHIPTLACIKKTHSNANFAEQKIGILPDVYTELKLVTEKGLRKFSKFAELKKRKKNQFAD